jgi:cysteinyl-tRNA synthetase
MLLLRIVSILLLSGFLPVASLVYAADKMDYKQLMRDFVQSISVYSKKRNPDFLIIPQNGHELMREGGDTDGKPAMEYIDAVDGAGQEDLFFGYDDDNRATPRMEREYLIFFLDTAKKGGVVILVTDYCWNRARMDEAFKQNSMKGYISFAAPERDLNVIPDYPRPIRNENSDDITSLTRAKNFLYLLDPSSWRSKSRYLLDLKATNYDVIIMDAFFEDGDGNQKMLTPEDVKALKVKKNRGKRLVISYMSIGEAEEYRYYWQRSWNTFSPSWLDEENPDWPGNYKVRYWSSEWQAVIFGSRSSYLDRIMDAGFDGVYLDIIDAFEHFE